MAITPLMISALACNAVSKDMRTAADHSFLGMVDILRWELPLAA
jgi:hypothetical protein